MTACRKLEGKRRTAVQDSYRARVVGWLAARSEGVPEVAPLNDLCCAYSEQTGDPRKMIPDVQGVVRITLEESSGCHDMDVNRPGLSSCDGARISCFRYLYTREFRLLLRAG